MCFDPSRCSSGWSARETHAAAPAEPRLARGRILGTVVDKVVGKVRCSAHLVDTHCSPVAQLDGQLLIFRGPLQLLCRNPTKMASGTGSKVASAVSRSHPSGRIVGEFLNSRRAALGGGRPEGRGEARRHR